MVDRFGKSNALLLSRFGDNIVPRVSLLCLPCWERPWLRLVMWPSRIWVVNKTWAVAETLPALSDFGVEFCWWRMLHYSCRLQTIEDYRSQRNSAAEWKTNLTTCLANEKCHAPNRSETSGSFSWIFEYFLFCQVFWMLKSISITRPISRVICLAVDLQQYKMIYSLVDISLYLYFIRYQVDVSLHLDKTCLNTIPCHTQELYFAKW